MIQKSGGQVECREEVDGDQRQASDQKTKTHQEKQDPFQTVPSARVHQELRHLSERVYAKMIIHVPHAFLNHQLALLFQAFAEEPIHKSVHHQDDVCHDEQHVQRCQEHSEATAEASVHPEPPGQFFLLENSFLLDG